MVGRVAMRERRRVPGAEVLGAEVLGAVKACWCQPGKADVRVGVSLERLTYVLVSAWKG